MSLQMILSCKLLSQIISKKCQLTFRKKKKEVILDKINTVFLSISLWNNVNKET